MKSRALAYLLCVLVGSAFAWVTAWGQVSPEAKIRSLAVDFRGQQVLATFELADAFDEDLHRRVESGLPTRLVYQFQLQKDRSSWFDQAMAEAQLQVIAMFNAITGEYLINFKHDGRLVESRVVRDRDDVRRAMTELDSFPAFSTEQMVADTRYRLRVRAEIGTRNFLAFIPRTVGTEWAESPKFSLGDTLGRPDAAGEGLGEGPAEAGAVVEVPEEPADGVESGPGPGAGSAPGP